MITVNQIQETYAVRYAVEFAKIICANPNVKIEPNKESAEALVEFIQTVADGLQSSNSVK